MDLFAPAYMTRFHCLGSDCPDTCCQSWTIYVDRKHYEALRDRLTAPDERAQLARYLRKYDGPERDRGHQYALMVLDENKRCGFLTQDNLCQIHARYGEDLLPETCAAYPRQLRRIGERVELTAVLSCGEAARLVLAEDDALEMVTAAPELLGRGWLNYDCVHVGKDPYEASFISVRALLLGLIGNRRFPLASRLFFLAFFADRTKTSLRRNAESFDAEMVDQIGAAMQSNITLADLHRQVRQVMVDPEFALSAVRALLGLTEAIYPARLRPLVREVAALYAERGAPLEGDLGVLNRAYHGLPPLAPELAARFDAMVERLVAHDLLRNWYVEQESLLGAMHGLLVRTAVFRFVLGSLARGGGRGQLDRAAFDALAVDVAYLLARFFDHRLEVKEQLAAELARHGLGLRSAVALAKI